MKLNNLQPLRPLAVVGTVPSIKPLINKRVSILNIPSQIELILLSTNLLYQSKLILDGASKRTGDLKAMACTNQAIKIMDIADNYQSKYLTHKEVKQIRKEFKLNSLYK